MRHLPLSLLFLTTSVLAAPAAVNVDVLQTKLDHPWALAFLPDDGGKYCLFRH